MGSSGLPTRVNSRAVRRTPTALPMVETSDEERVAAFRQGWQEAMDEKPKPAAAAAKQAPESA